MDVRGARRGIGDGRVDGGGGIEEVLRVGLGRLLRRVGLRLVGRGGLGGGRLLVGLGGVGGRKGGAASEARLGEAQAVGVGSGRAQASHDGRGQRSLSSVGHGAGAGAVGGRRASKLVTHNTRASKRSWGLDHRHETRSRDDEDNEFNDNRDTSEQAITARSRRRVGACRRRRYRRCCQPAGRGSRGESVGSRRRTSWPAPLQRCPGSVEIAKRLQFPARAAFFPCVYIASKNYFFNSSTSKQTRNPGSGVSLMGLAEACKAWRCGAG